MKKEADFKIPISSLSGSRVSNFLKLTRKYGIEKKYYIRWFNSFIISCICSFFGLFDSLIYALKSKPKIVKDPVFIIGHWRSGTTFLHNLICLDKEVGYPTTYQTVFPNNIFAFQWLFKGIVRFLMPNNRPVDNVKLDPDYPQEEEFALNNEYIFSYYNWWYFPKKIKEITEEYLLSNTASKTEIKKFKTNYKRFVNRCLLNTNGERFVSKNPPNTARVKWLLEMYPNAKFIFIHRNPYEVVRSTFNFYKSILPPLQLQSMNEEALQESILTTYKLMIEKYYLDKKVLDQNNLIEITYNDLTKNPQKIIKTLYTDFLKEDYDRIKLKVNETLKVSHPLKNYSYNKDYTEMVNHSLKNIIEKQNYKVL